MGKPAVSFSAELSMGDAYHVEKKEEGSKLIGKWIVEGYASTSDLDAQDHIISEGAIAMGAEGLAKYRTVLYNHDANRPIGQIVLTEARQGRLFVKVSISQAEPVIWEKIKDGTLSKFSIKGRILDAEKRIIDAESRKDATGETPDKNKKEILFIKGVELHEVSVVSVPANIAARSLAWYVEKALKEDPDGAKALVEGDETGKAVHTPDTSNEGGMKQCVASKIRANMKEGKSREQAIAIATTQCKKDTSKAEDESYDWLPALLQEIDSEFKVNSKGGDKSVEKKDISKNRENVLAAIADLEEAMKTLEGEAKDQVESVITSLKALDEAVYGGEAGDTKSEKKADEGKEDEVKKAEAKKAEAKKAADAEEAKKADEAKKASETDSLAKLVTGIQDAIKASLTEVKGVADAAKSEADKVAEMKADMEKKMDAVVEALAKFPLRKSKATPDVEDDRNKDEDLGTISGLTKKVKSEEGFEKLPPGDQLHRVLRALTGEDKNDK